MISFFSTSPRSSLFVSAHFCARRFGGTAARRASSFAEISEACAVLGVDVDCDPRQLKRTYRDLVRKHHPDAGGDEATMSRITVAYERLSGMSKSEREHFHALRAAYRGGTTTTTTSSTTGSGRAGQNRTGAGYTAYGASGSGGGGAQGFYAPPNDDYFAQRPTGQRGHYTYQQQGRRYGENPFSSTHPFAFHTQLRRAWTMPLSSILLRGIVVYLGLSIIFLLIYRQYRDWLHDDGWKMSESLARHEQLLELQRVRQEMNERIRAAREAAAAHNASVRAFVSRENDGTDYNTATSSQGQELRALEYARRRQMEMSEEVKGWPQFGDEKGRLIRRAQDPPGVVFFEPRKEDERFRQLRNLQSGRGWGGTQQGVGGFGDKGVLGEKPVVTTAGPSTPFAAPADVDLVSRINALLGGVSDGSQNTTRGA